MSKYKILLFLFISVFIWRINIQESEAQTCISSVYPTTIYFDHNPSYTNDIEAIELNFSYWCDTYNVVPSEEWIIILHIDYEEGIVYVVTDDNYDCSARYGYITIDGYYNVDVEQDPGVPSWPGVISGSSSKCSGTSGNYSVPGAQGAASHTWAASNGASITSGQGTTSVTIYFPNAGTSDVLVKGVNSCGDGNLSDLNVSVSTSVPAQPGAISGEASRCQETTGTYSISAEQGATSYTWSATNGASILSGQGTISVSIKFFSSGTSTVSVYAVNGCGNGTPRTLNVTVNALPTVSAGSNSPVWSESTINLSSTGGFSNYSWIGPPNNTYSSNVQNPSRTNANTAMTGIYYVTVTDANGCAKQTSTSVTVNALPYLYVKNSNGFVGMGGVYNPQYGLHVKGSDVKFYRGKYSSIQFNLSGIEPAIWTNAEVNFRNLERTNYMDVACLNCNELSDISAKKDVQSIKNGIDRILLIRGITFSWRNDPKGLKNAGLIAQEVERVIPGIVYTRKKTQQKFLTYSKINPYLIEAIKDLSLKLENQKKLLDELNDSLKYSPHVNSDVDSSIVKPYLGQIIPKSSESETIISYIIEDNFRNASINIYNIDGYQVLSLKNIFKGKGEVVINKDQLKPGEYIYNLIIDGKEIYQKQMILTH